LPLPWPGAPPPSSAEATIPESPAPTEDAAAAWAAYDHGDYATTLSLAQPAAKRGDPEAQCILGLLYGNGQGVAQDYAEALRWYQKAADQGNAGAQYNIGFLYQKGLGVAQDYAEALRWYQKAANQGHAGAQYNIGFLYQNGQGVAQDMAQARAWMQKAAAAGDENAKQWLARNKLSILIQSCPCWTISSLCSSESRYQPFLRTYAAAGLL